MNCWKLFNWIIEHLLAEVDFMKVYDATCVQVCAICGFSSAHNKQGRFTQHVKNEHQLTLHEYLIRYFYEPKQLVCSYPICEQQVKLRRGMPNRFCSKSCSSKRNPLVCVICNTSFEASHRQTKTCSKACATILRSQNTRRWHAMMSEEDKKHHFQRIIQKTAETRTHNGTPSWNSGKKGIYTEEIIEKIRQATLRQLQRETFRKTAIERKVEQFFIESGIPYQYSFITHRVQFDFCLLKANVLIECDGDFWHANPKFYPNDDALYEVQRRIRAKDIYKSHCCTVRDDASSLLGR